MPRTIRFHLDESCDHAIASGLRRRGVDITIPADVGLTSASDGEQLEFACREGRTLITADTDFLQVNATGIDHPGVLFCRPNRRIGPVIREIMLIWEVYEPSEMKQRIEYV